MDFKQLLKRRKLGIVLNSALFDKLWYERQAGMEFKSVHNAAWHYMLHGNALGLNPHPLFDVKYYKEKYPDITSAQLDPLVHFLLFGAAERRNPHPLFDTNYYLDANPDVASSKMNPLTHFVLHGGLEGRDPHPAFASAYYLAQYGDVLNAKINPLVHYMYSGATERRNPHPGFNTAHYVDTNPGVAESALNPLVHYVTIGAAKGLLPSAAASISHSPTVTEALVAQTTTTFAAVGTAVGEESQKKGYCPPLGLLPWFNPINVVAVPELALRPRLNVLIPGLAMRHMSGGPNTALNYVFRLAALGIPLRLISTDAPPDADQGPLLKHCRQLAGLSMDVELDLVVEDASNRQKPVGIGANDLFFATAWWTAQMARYAMRVTKHQKFIYFIQDYEPIFHEGSTQKSLAEETYTLNFLPIINTGLLKDYFVKNKVGRFADPEFAESALYFEPAIDIRSFHYAEAAPGKKRVLFYARPTVALRNLFELGVAAIQKVVADGIVDPKDWEFVGMGEQFTPVALGAGLELRPAPWLGFEAYARMMRESTVLLSLMQSPHPSYPPIEFAACGKPAVTTEYANKTAAELEKISPNIIACRASIEELARGLSIAINRSYSEEKGDTAIGFPSTWDESFKDLVLPVASELKQTLGLVPMRTTYSWQKEGDFLPGFDDWPANEYAMQRVQALQERAVYPLRGSAMFSLLTTVWNTAPEYLYQLADTVFAQTSGTDFEWVILDNGSLDKGTKAAIANIARHPSVRLFKVPENIGIIRGMNYVLEKATRRYVVPLDSDDLLTPDCLSVIAGELERAGYPALSYSDEDKVLGSVYRDPYIKPDWDPVLFFHSCYIAHLCAIDRELLSVLGGYTDEHSTGCHDWDTFTRFHLAGHRPLHIPEVLYTWRMHEQSTAGNISSKDYIARSHKNVLGRFLASAPEAEHLTVEYSPIFNGTPDWRLLHNAALSKPVVSVLLGDAQDRKKLWIDGTPESHEIVYLENPDDFKALRSIAATAAEKGALLHILSDQVQIDDPLWFQEAISLLHLFPDAAVVGGRCYKDGFIRAADLYFNVEHGLRSPNWGKSLKDPGYFAQMWKPHSCDAVNAAHCVVRPNILMETLDRLIGTNARYATLGEWMGHLCAEKGQRVIYTPFLSARIIQQLPEASATEVNALRITSHWSDQKKYRRWPHKLSVRAATAFGIVDNARRKAEENVLAEAAVDAETDLDAAYLARKFTVSVGSADRCYPTVSMLTSVYERTPAALFRATAESLQEQTLPYTEWVILENGPIPDDVAAVLADLQNKDHRVVRLKVARNLGIMGAMKYCLDRASSELVVPMDADDLLIPDALECLVGTLVVKQADFVFSDEVLWSDDKVIATVRRGDFDPIINANDSYIWHLCAFRRDVGNRIGVYSDKGAEFAHDWDSVTRFWRSGAKIEHVPHVLYKWRVHTHSSSNSGSVNEGSLSSVRHILQSQIDGQEKPERYEIAPFPMWRGAEQLAVIRKPKDPSSIAFVVLGLGRQQPAVPLQVKEMAKRNGLKVATVSNGISADGGLRIAAELKKLKTDLVIFLVEGTVPDDENGLWEAMRLLEMHPDVVLVGGRVYKKDGLIISSGAPVQDKSGGQEWVGKRIDDTGPFATMLKPQSAVSVPMEFFGARVSFLRTVDWASINMSSLGVELGVAAQVAGQRVAYSPLIQARAVVPIETLPH